MTFPVLVQPINGQFAASLVGDPAVRVTAPSPTEALAALKTVLEQRVAQGELVSLEIERGGVAQLAGKYRDDPTLRGICEEAYQQRNSGPVE